MAGPIESSGGGTSLTDHQLAKLAALPVPDRYDSGRPLTARVVPGIMSAVVLAVNADTETTADVSANAHTMSLDGSAALSTTFDEITGPVPTIDPSAWAGDSSVYLPGGSGDRISTPYHADFDIQTSDFDLRFSGWHRGGAGSPWNAGAADGVGIWTGAEKAFHLSLRSAGGSNPTLHFSFSTAGSDDDARAVSIGDYALVEHWNHFRACRVGNLFMMFVNEILLYTEDFTGVDIHTPVLDPDLQIGDLGGLGTPWQGYIDGVFLQVGGTVVTGEFVVDRRLFSASDQTFYQPETSNKINGPFLIDTDRELSPIEGECVYRVTGGAHIITLKPMAEWGGWVPHIFNDDAFIPEVAYDSADSIDGDLGSVGNITLDSQYGHIKIRKQTRTTAIAEGRFSQP